MELETAPAKKITSKTIKGPMLAKKIYGIHQLAGKVFGPEAEIEAQSAEELANAITDVLKEYDITFSGKTAALAGLTFTVLAVEGPIVYKLFAKKPKALPEGGKVFEPVFPT